MANPTNLKKCPCCGGELEGFIQKIIRETPQVTCFNPQCAVFGYTLHPDNLVKKVNELKLQES